MPGVPMIPVFHLKSGDKIASKFVIGKSQVSHWQFAQECPNNMNTFPPGSVFEIFEVNTMVPPWVKAYIPDTHNTQFLKIAGGELSTKFLLCR